MEVSYSQETIAKLRDLFSAQRLLRPLRLQRYETGQRLRFEMESVYPARKMEVGLEVIRFVGGGYSGQVYKVKILRIDGGPEGQEGLQAGGTYALKIFVPPGALGGLIRNFFYALGFQGPFSLRVNPAAVKAGALWQRFIRRGARIRFGSEDSVANVLATFIDPGLGSCGEISEWVDGRMWRLEVDDNLYSRRLWKPGQPGDGLGSPEYRAKKAFMFDLVKLMRDMGAEELARQYEWGTLKSQPNALKRLAMGADPGAGLTAVDFRAGLVLLPFLPECPADFKLIVRGIRRGSLVQFDRGDIRKLESYTAARPDEFADLAGALEELKTADRAYRDSLPDLTHHHVKLITRPRLWAAIHSAWVRAWEIRNMADAPTAGPLGKSGLAALLFLLLGLVPVLTPILFILKFPGRSIGLWLLWLAPLLGPFIRKLWGRRDLRRHFGAMLTKGGYVGRARRGHAAEALIRWVRRGRVSESRALRLAAHPLWFCAQLPMSVLPPKLHRFLTDWEFAKKSLDRVFVKPFRLYFQPAEREKWLRDMVSQGEKNGILTPEESRRIQSQIQEPFIQKYLKSLAIHVLLMPTTHIVALLVAFFYIRLHPGLSGQQEALATGLILGIFQVIPVSPGSIARGIYTTTLIVRERNFKDYNLAFAISFFKYIGYFAFPLQMAYRYPELARFMAGHSATGAAHIVPIFGEKGAWLEHAAFDLFYNYPLSLGRRIRERDASFSTRPPRRWTFPAVVGACVVILALIDAGYLKLSGQMPALVRIWWLVIWIPFLGASLAAGLSRRPRLSRRISLGALAGALMGLIYAGFGAALGALAKPWPGGPPAGDHFVRQLAIQAVWHIFLFLLIAVLGVLIFENRRPEPQQDSRN
jgi:hypothetical protein